MMKLYFAKGTFIIYNSLKKIGYTNIEGEIPLDYRILANFPVLSDGGVIKLSEEIKSPRKVLRFEKIPLKGGFRAERLKVFGYCEEENFLLAVIRPKKEEALVYASSHTIVFTKLSLKWILPVLKYGEVSWELKKDKVVVVLPPPYP